MAILSNSSYNQLRPYFASLVASLTKIHEPIQVFYSSSGGLNNRSAVHLSCKRTCKAAGVPAPR
jgi:hypothetical protein